MDISRCKPRLYFEKNLGQLPSEVKYKLKSKEYTTFYTEDKLVVSLPSNIKNTRNVFYMKFENTKNDVQIIGQEKQNGIINYLVGNDESQWINDIPIYSKLKYHKVYENIDLYYYVNSENLEYDFVISNGGNPKDICISFEGVDDLVINDNDDIVITVGDVKAILLKPEIYQIIDEVKIYIDCKYILGEDGCITFLVNEYEKEYELVLDPVLKLDYSTFIGGTMCDFGMGIAVDSEGCVYVTGYTEGDYPTTTGQTTFGGGSMDAFVTKLSKEGNSLIYSTYIGGTGADYSSGIAIDGVGCAYIIGSTQSKDFPVTLDSYQITYGGNNDAFVTKLNQDGRLLIYSTYLGGSKYNVGYGIAVDSEGYAYVTGQTGNYFPVTTGAYKTTFGGNTDAFVSKLDINGKNLIYSTYLGGSDYDCAYGIAIDKSGCAYITGYAGGNFPITIGSVQTVYKGDTKDAFVSKLSEDGSKLIYSTYIGGSSVDQGNAITVDDEGYAYVVGYTKGNYPLKNPTQNNFGGNRDIIVSKISIDGSELVYSTTIGQQNAEDGYSIAVDKEGYAYITGYSVGDVVFIKLNTEGNKVIYNVSLHNGDNEYGRGIAVDKEGNIYIAGYAESNYTTTTGAYQTICGGNHDVVVSKILLIDFNLSLDYKQNKVKLLDIIKTNLIFKNLSNKELDVKIKIQPLDSSVTFENNSLFIQGMSYLSNTIPEEIYLYNIYPNKIGEVEFDLKYISEKFPDQIPITITVEVYVNNTGTSVLVESRTNKYYIDTIVGTNYIPGCNSNLYNLEIDGKMQTTSSGTPIIYYKSDNSYIYIEPNKDKYVYKVLQNSNYIVEYKII